MKIRTDWPERLPLGPLALAGLACFVLAVFAAALPAPAATTALVGAAVALWLVALAGFAFRRRGSAVVVALPLAVAVVFGLISTVSAGQAMGLLPSAGGGRPAQEVAGVTARPIAPRGAASPVRSSQPPDSASPATPAAAATASDATPAPTDTVPASPAATQPGSATHTGPVTIDSLEVTSPVAPGDQATATVRSNPSVACSIGVGYPGGSEAAGLDPTVTDDSGAASWTWRVDPGTPGGTWPVRVTCSAPGGWSAWWTVGIRVR